MNALPEQTRYALYFGPPSPKIVQALSKASWQVLCPRTLEQARAAFETVSAPSNRARVILNARGGKATFGLKYAAKKALARRLRTWLIVPKDPDKRQALQPLVDELLATTPARPWPMLKAAQPATIAGYRAYELNPTGPRDNPIGGTYDEQEDEYTRPYELLDIFQGEGYLEPMEHELDTNNACPPPCALLNQVQAAATVTDIEELRGRAAALDLDMAIKMYNRVGTHTDPKHVGQQVPDRVGTTFQARRFELETQPQPWGWALAPRQPEWKKQLWQGKLPSVPDSRYAVYDHWASAPQDRRTPEERLVYRRYLQRQVNRGPSGRGQRAPESTLLPNRITVIRVDWKCAYCHITEIPDEDKYLSYEALPACSACALALKTEHPIEDWGEAPE